MIELKSPRELDAMRRAGTIVGRTLFQLQQIVEPGMTTADLDKMAEGWIRDAGAIPAFKGYNGFPATLCTSVNDEVVHGIPGPRTLADGDIISIDCGAIVDGFYGDAAVTLAVGEISDEARRLLDVTERSLWAGIAAARPGARLGDIGHAIQSAVEPEGFGIVRDYAGHGIGRNMHEEPQILNFGPGGTGPVLRPGLTLAIEPMVNAGTFEVFTAADGWTVKTRDGSLSAHFEHTIAVTDGEPEVLTMYRG